MSAETKIREMLVFLHENKDWWVFSVRQSSPGVFSVPGSWLNITDKEFLGRDEQSVVIDFNKNTITWWAAHTSMHNGSSFGETSGTVPWENLVQCQGAAENAVRAKIKRDFEKEDEERRKKVENDRIESRMKRLFRD